MKKPIIITFGLALLLLVGFSVAMVAPHLNDPAFEIVNQSKHVVSVSAHWRDKSKDLGPIHPASSYKFKVGDEAAMKFTVRYPDGQRIESKEIYFTGGTYVIAAITEASIEARYDHET